MSFFASNNRIEISDASGKKIFDTSRPMPHLFQMVQRTVNVTFPDMDGYYDRVQHNLGPSLACRRSEMRYTCEMEYVCTPVQVCEPGPPPYYLPQCRWENQCGWENVCANRWVDVYYDEWLVDQGFVYPAKEWEQTVDLGPVTAGIDADFLLVDAVASRSHQGVVPDVNGIPCGIPLGASFIAQNSSIIECISDLSGTSGPWMTRIMSIFVEGGRVKCQFKHSNRAFVIRSRWRGGFCSYSSAPPFVGGIPETVPPTHSSYAFNLTILLGKFTL